MSIHTAIPLPIEALREFCQRHGIVRLEVFGSILREDFGPTSDVDFLCTFSDGSDDLGLWELLALSDELGEIVGRPADLAVRADVEEFEKNLGRRATILGSAEVLVEFPVS